MDGSEEDSIPLKALISGNFQGAVDCYLQNGRWAEALVLAACGGPEIWKKTQDAFFAKQTSPAMRVVCHVVNQDLRSLVAASDLSQWRVTLAILCTYAGPEDFTSVYLAVAFLVVRLELIFALLSSVEILPQYCKTLVIHMLPHYAQSLQEMWKAW